MAVICASCGKSIPEGASFCPHCGAVQVVGAPIPGGAAGAAPPVASTYAPTASPTPVASVRYAGFWRRFWAFVVDGCILSIVMLPFGIGMWGTIAAIGHSGGDEVGTLARIIAASMMAMLLRATATWLYGALFESSAWQATPGKKLLGLTVTDLEGRRVTFLRATGRALGKWLSGFILCIGFIMVAFTEKKQGLHDMLAGTLVRR